MSEGVGAMFNCAKVALFNGDIDLTDHVIKFIMVTAWTPTVRGTINYATFAGITEESGTGYNVGGETLGGKAVTQDDVLDRAKWDGNDITWTGLNIGTPGHLIAYDDTHASDIAIAYWELGRASNGSDYKATFAATGIILLT